MAEIQIELTGGNHLVVIDSLVRWLREIPQLRDIRFEVDSEDMTTTLAADLEPTAVGAVTEAIVRWLELSVSPQVAVRLSVRGGSTLEVSRDTSVEAIEIYARSLAASQANAVDNHKRVPAGVGDVGRGPAAAGRSVGPGRGPGDDIVAGSGSLPSPPMYRTDDGRQMPLNATLPITIYLSDESAHGQVEAAVDGLMVIAGLAIANRDEPIEGSWFRRLWAQVRVAVHSSTARESAATAAHAVETRVSLAQDAAYTALLLQNIGPVLTSLQPTKDAVLRIGAVLIVKVDWTVTVYQLTAAQQFKLDHKIDLAKSPQEIAAALHLQQTQITRPTAFQHADAGAQEVGTKPAVD